MNNFWKKALKIVTVVIAAVLALVLLVWGGLNLVKFALYHEYYSIKDDLCVNPGLDDGFVCQGITAVSESGKVLVSGYMKDGSASRIYVTDKTNDSYFVTLTSAAAPFDGHAGGIAYFGEQIYLADGGKVYTFPLSTVLNAEKSGTVEIGEGTEVNNSASFIYADETYIYVGEFHDGGKYVTDHPYDTPDGRYHAIVSRYSPDDLTAPNKIYSIRDKVQGICFTPDGRVVLSTSYGLADSVYYVYNEGDAVDSGLTLDGAPLYYLNGCVREVKGPAMSEGLDYYEGKVITLTESASNKYIFGKFFFANKIVSLDF